LRIEYITYLRDLPLGGETKDLAKEKVSVAIIEECRLVIDDGGNKGGRCQKPVVCQEHEIGDFPDAAAVCGHHLDDTAAVGRMLS
jgi:hypothetical protein